MSESIIPGSLMERLRQTKASLLTIKKSNEDSFLLDSIHERNRTIIHVHTVSTGNFIIINPENLLHTVNFCPMKENGKIVDGFAVVYVKSRLQQIRRPLCVFSITDIRQKIVKKWEIGYLISPGDEIEVVFEGYDVLDPTKTTLEYTVDNLNIRN